MKLLLIAIKIALLLLGGVLLLGGGACAVIDISLLGQAGKGLGSFESILFFTFVSVAIAAIGGLILRAVIRSMSKQKEARSSDNESDLSA